MRDLTHLTGLVTEINWLAEERELLMAAERTLSHREQRLERGLLTAHGGSRKDVETFRRVAARLLVKSSPEEITQRLCWPGFVYATAYCDHDGLMEEVFS